MATNRKRRGYVRRSRRFDEFDEFCFESQFTEYGSTFGQTFTDEQLDEGWQWYKSERLADFIEQYPGTRPPEWWKRERGIDMLDAGLLGHPEKELAYLREHGLLTRAERE